MHTHRAYTEEAQPDLRKNMNYKGVLKGLHCIGYIDVVQHLLLLLDSSCFTNIQAI